MIGLETSDSSKILAGRVEDINGDLRNWVFVDLGFSEKQKTCGLLIGDDEPTTETFSECARRVRDFIGTQTKPTQLVIEAPLSVAFTPNGNPKGRSIEKVGNSTRYWYNGLGCAVMVSALYLVRELLGGGLQHEVRLFEGFVSFKKKEAKSDHSLDVRLLREVVCHPQEHSNSIIPPENLRMAKEDKLESAFKVCGFDPGIPPIIKPDARVFSKVASP